MPRLAHMVWLVVVVVVGVAALGLVGLGVWAVVEDASSTSDKMHGLGIVLGLIAAGAGSVVAISSAGLVWLVRRRPTAAAGLAALPVAWGLGWSALSLLGFVSRVSWSPLWIGLVLAGLIWIGVSATSPRWPIVTPRSSDRAEFSSTSGTSTGVGVV